MLQNDVLEADELLEDSRYREYALTATMLGLIETGQSAQAHSLWVNYANSISATPIPPYMPFWCVNLPKRTRLSCNSGTD